MNSLRPYWPEVNNVESAEKCILNAAHASYFVAGITAVMALLAFLDIFHLSSSWAILDALVFAAIGFYISRKSRIAAVLGLTLYLLEWVDRLLSGSGGSAGAMAVMGMLISLWFINGIRATFYLSRLQPPKQLETP